MPMANYFTSGQFDLYKTTSLSTARSDPASYYTADRKITVFISHKHEDLNDLMGVIGFLEKQYNVRCYIDGLDQTMPKVTSAETAEKLKNRIKTCNKFILLATTKAIESKWCNWELGYGDSQKYKSDSLAIFPIKMKSELSTDFKGNEYMDIYPTVVYRDGTTKYADGTVIEKAYYVRTKNQKGSYTLTPLYQWLRSKNL